MFSRRSVLAGASLAMALAVTLAIPHGVRAADPLKVGILIPGSKSDKGWMESGYDGLDAAQKKYGDKIKVQIIENINYADMEQALTNLATQERSGDRRRRPDPGVGLQGRQALPQGEFSIVGGNEGELAAERRAATT